MIEVSEVQIVPIKATDGLVAFASVVVDNNFYLGSIGVHTKLGGGYRLTYPTKQAGGRNLNIYHPINKIASEAIETAIISKVKEVIERSNDRHHCFNNEKQRFYNS